jgi:hypothetical protein
VLLGITAIDFIRFIEERVELQDGFILVRQALSIFLIGLGRESISKRGLIRTVLP